MVIFNELFQTVRFLKWYLHFDTPSCFCLMKASVLSSGYTKSVRAFNGRTGPLAWRKTMRGLSGARTTLSRLSANGLFYGQAGDSCPCCLSVMGILEMPSFFTLLPEPPAVHLSVGFAVFAPCGHAVRPSVGLVFICQPVRQPSCSTLLLPEQAESVLTEEVP